MKTLTCEAAQCAALAQRIGLELLEAAEDDLEFLDPLVRVLARRLGLCQDCTAHNRVRRRQYTLSYARTRVMDNGRGARSSPR
jgi:hypothetical protein